MLVGILSRLQRHVTSITWLKRVWASEVELFLNINGHCTTIRFTGETWYINYQKALKETVLVIQNYHNFLLNFMLLLCAEVIAREQRCDFICKPKTFFNWEILLSCLSKVYIFACFTQSGSAIWKTETQFGWWLTTKKNELRKMYDRKAVIKITRFWKLGSIPSSTNDIWTLFVNVWYWGKVAYWTAINITAVTKVVFACRFLISPFSFASTEVYCCQLCLQNLNSAVCFYPKF